MVEGGCGDADFFVDPPHAARITTTATNGAIKRGLLTRSMW